MVKRFDLVSGYMQKWPEGNWVEYEDYAALEKDRDYWYTRCLDAGLLDEDAEMDAAKRAGVFDE
jgi:hypothetical protein